MVHSEIILQRYGRVGLRSRFNLHILLGLDGLMQAVRVPTSVQNTSGLLIHDLDGAIHHHVFNILGEQRKGFQ